MIQTLQSAGRFGRKLWRDKAGLALTEFAYAAPLFAGLGLAGLEIANYSVAHLSVSQVASNIADTISRSGEDSGLGLKRIRETHINDALEAVAMQAEGLDLVGRGRIIVSSIEQNDDGKQLLRWQRCIGERTDFISDYGVEGANEVDDDFVGMGPVGARATAPDTATAVMFVEVKYQYQPLIDLSFAGLDNDLIQSRSAFIVRDRRDLSVGNDPFDDVEDDEQRLCGEA